MTAPAAATSNASSGDVRCASAPQLRPPAAMPAENTMMYSASARALTQAGTAVCAAICNEDSTVIQAKPLTSITSGNTYQLRVSARPARLAASDKVASSTSRSRSSFARSFGSSSAPPTAPMPMQPSSTPYCPAPPCICPRTTTGNIAFIAAAKKKKPADLINTACRRPARLA
ncbi:hypothetical protein D3C73_701870 [compost metagenome]